MLKKNNKNKTTNKKKKKKREEKTEEKKNYPDNNEHIDIEKEDVMNDCYIVFTFPFSKTVSNCHWFLLATSS